MARMKYLTGTRGGPQAMAETGVTATPATIRAWTKGKQRPKPANLEAIDTAYWNLRARNVLANPGALKQHLNRGGHGTRMEIHPINQAVVDEPARRNNLRVRRLHIRYIWDAAVDALVDGDLSALDDVWDDVIAELDSDWGAYTYVAHIGLGA